MNSVNQMVSDLKDRMNDESTENLVKKNKRQLNPKSKKKSSSVIFVAVVLGLAVGGLAWVNYSGLLEQKPKIAQNSKAKIISVVPRDKKINVVQEIPSKLESQVAALNVKPTEINKPKEQLKVKRTPVVAKKEVKHVEKPEQVVKVEATKKQVVKKQVAKTKLAVPPKVTVKEVVLEKSPEKAPVKIAKRENKKPVVRPVGEKKPEKVVKVAKVKPKVKPEIKSVVKPKTPAKKQPVKVATVAAATAVEDQGNDFNKIPVPLTEPELAETIFQRGAELLEQGETDRAVSMFKKALKEYPSHLKSTESLVGIYSSQQSWEQMEDVLTAGIQADRKNISLSMWLAQIYLQQQRAAEAITVLTSNVKYARNNGEYLALLAAIYQNTEQYDLAVDAYQKALKVDDSSSQWWFGMAVVLELKNNLVDAQVSYTQALQTGRLSQELVTYAEQRLEYVISQNELSAVQ